MIEINKSTVKHQEVKMVNRKLLEISGVSKVEGFDSEEFLLDTECGFLTIRGHNLHIKNLDLEQCLIVIEGTVDSLVYLDANARDKSKSFFGKLFK